MAFTLASTFRNIHGYGIKRGEYDLLTREAVNKILEARKNSDCRAEALIIEALKEIEASKNTATTRAASDLGSKAAKICGGPVAGIAAMVVGSVAKDGDLKGALVEVATKEAKTQVTKAVCQEGAEWVFGYAADFFGLAVGTVAVAAAPVAFSVAAVGGVAACALSETARNRCMSAISNTAKGVTGLLSEAVDLALPSGGNAKIIQTYNSWNEKKTKFLIKKQVLDQNTCSLKSQLERSQAKLALSTEKFNDCEAFFSVQDNFVMQQQVDLVEEFKAYQAFKKTIKKRGKKGWGSFVRLCKNSTFLNDLFTFLFKTFKNEKKIRDSLRELKKQIEENIDKIEEKIETLSPLVDDLFLEKEDAKDNKVKFIKEVNDLEVQLDRLTDIIAMKQAKLDEYEQNYVDSLY